MGNKRLLELRRWNNCYCCRSELSQQQAD